jgi:hypothetical protein
LVLVLPSFIEERLGGATLESWQLFPLVKEAMDMPTLVGAIEALRAQGLTIAVVVRTFIHRQILPLRERVHPLWLHQGITNPMMEFPYPISMELLRVLVIGAIGVEYPGEGVDLPSTLNVLLPWVTCSSGWCRSPLFPLLGWSGCG